MADALPEHHGVSATAVGAMAFIPWKHGRNDDVSAS